MPLGPPASTGLPAAHDNSLKPLPGQVAESFSAPAVLV